MSDINGEPAAEQPTAAWVERKLRIPADTYPQLRPLLGWLAMTHGVEISTPGGAATGEAVAVYNEDKVVWMEDPDPNGVGLRPVIPFGCLLDYDDPDKRRAANRLVGGIRNSVARGLYQSSGSGAVNTALTPFVYVQPALTEPSKYHIVGLYADRAFELAGRGGPLEHVHDVGLDSIMLFHEFCEDLIVPSGPKA
jgi:hypothetical protein